MYTNLFGKNLPKPLQKILLIILSEISWEW